MAATAPARSIKHEVCGEIYRTTNYDQFKNVDGNRVINPSHLSRLTASMSEKHLMSPIIVNEKMHVIDGQHRLAASAALGLPVNYIICKGYDLSELQTLNQNAKNWTSVEFIHCYADRGYEDYILFREFQKKYKFGHNECVSLLKGTSDSRSILSDIKAGLFKIKSLEYAEDMALKIMSCNQFYPGAKRRSFIYALMAVTKKDVFQFDEFIEKLRLQRGKMYDCATIEQYISLIEEIYNYRRQNKINLRF